MWKSPREGDRGRYRNELAGVINLNETGLSFHPWPRSEREDSSTGPTYPQTVAIIHTHPNQRDPWISQPDRDTVDKLFEKGQHVYVVVISLSGIVVYDPASKKDYRVERPGWTKEYEAENPGVTCP